MNNVQYTNYESYLDSLIKSLSNFCDKSPLKPTIKVVKELGMVYVYYGDDMELEIKIETNKDKKLIIGEVKKILEKEYPIIYKKTNKIPNADEVRKILNEGKSLEEALNSTQVDYEPLYKIERVHDKYNEVDLLSLKDGDMYKFKCKIPVIAILEDLKYNKEDSDVMENLNLLYKINSER